VQMMEGKMNYESNAITGIEYFIEIPIIKMYAEPYSNSNSR
jgi:hypothetical protein